MTNHVDRWDFLTPKLTSFSLLGVAMADTEKWRFNVKYIQLLYELFCLNKCCYCFSPLDKQEQVEEMKKKEERMEKQMNEIQLENKRLKEPLEKAKEEVAELTRQLANYEKDKASLAVSDISVIHKPL